jgi:hypothetical protein
MQQISRQCNPVDNEVFHDARTTKYMPYEHHFQATECCHLLLHITTRLPVQCTKFSLRRHGMPCDILATIGLAIVWARWHQPVAAITSTTCTSGSHAFSRNTISCWLSCAQHFLDGTVELALHDKQQLSTVTGLTQVLAFADAVGSCLGLGKFACSQLQQLKFVVQLPEQVRGLPVNGYAYWFNHDKQLYRNSLQPASVRVGAPLASIEQYQDVQQQVAAQLSALLQLAHVLRLQQLLDVLHSFVLQNVGTATSCLLAGVVGLVFSDAVLEAALGSTSTFSKEAYISSMLSQPCSLTPGNIGCSSLLKPVGPKRYDTQNEVLVFDAELLRDFAGGRAGDTVKVALDLFGKH